jgi:hypothetical protein
VTADVRLAALGRFVLNATLPRIIQRRILRMLPPELGRYLLDGGTGVTTHGEIGAPLCHREQCCVGACTAIFHAI